MYRRMVLQILLSPGCHARCVSLQLHFFFFARYYKPKKMMHLNKVYEL